MKTKRQYLLVFQLKKSIPLPREYKISFLGVSDKSAKETAIEIMKIWGDDVRDWRLFYLVELDRKEKNVN
jgi:hypothetical protein